MYPFFINSIMNIFKKFPFVNFSHKLPNFTQIYELYSTFTNIYKENHNEVKFIKKIVLEHQETIPIPIFKMNEIAKLYEDTLNNMAEDLRVPKDIFDSFHLKNELNPEIWKGDKLRPEVIKSLIKIAKDFFKSLELPSNVKPKDILFVGSLANYNWSKFSDIDLHIVIDFNDLGIDPEQSRKRFDAEKNLYNLKHEITVHGYPVEVYVQHVKDKLRSTAIYSVANDKWVLMPEKTQFKLDKDVIKRKLDKLFDRLKNIETLYNKQEYKKCVTAAEDLKDDIKKMRQSGLESGGEYSTENVVFKILRRTEFMDILDSYKIKAYDNTVTIDEDQP